MSGESLGDVVAAIESVGADIGLDAGEQHRALQDEVFRAAVLEVLEARTRLDAFREETPARALRFPRRQQTFENFKKLNDMSADQLATIGDALSKNAAAKKQRDLDRLNSGV